MPDKPEYFRCPLRRSVSCERVVIKRRNAPDYVTAFFSCTTCTVMFLDPLAFTRGFEDRPRSPVEISREGSYTAWSRINQSRKERGE